MKPKTSEVANTRFFFRFCGIIEKRSVQQFSRGSDQLSFPSILIANFVLSTKISLRLNDCEAELWSSFECE